MKRSAGIDKAAAYRRLTGAGLGEAKASALVELLWNVHDSGEVAEFDLAHLSDAGFLHVEVCVMRELLLAALSRRHGRRDPAPVLTLLGAFGGRPDETPSG